MSVTLTSKDNSYSNNISNGTWAAIVALARAYDPSIPAWIGSHDEWEWTPQHLTVMADRLEQTAKQIYTLRELATRGGVIIT